MNRFQVNPRMLSSSKKSTPVDGFWGPTKSWIPSYRCNVCKERMTNKLVSKAPQVIYTCKHVVCAKCIAQSYFIELNPVCPVAGCGIYINPGELRAQMVEKPSTPPIVQNIINNQYNTWQCYCEINDCSGDCGVLWCGCIDACRGACGFKDYTEY